MKETKKKSKAVLFLIDVSDTDNLSPEKINTLSQDEILRANKLELTVKNNFIAGRAALRIILSKFLGSEPDRITFSYTRYGKPEISGGYSESSIKFNSSDSGCYILIGISRISEIGVDIQEIRALTTPDKLMRRQLTGTEYEKISVLDDDLRIKEFFRYWARKEAVLKASGIGLSFPMNKIDVSDISPEQSKEVICDGLTGRFFISDIEAENNYTSAVAIEGSHFTYRLIKLSFKDILDHKFTV